MSSRRAKPPRSRWSRPSGDGCFRKPRRLPWPEGGPRRCALRASQSLLLQRLHLLPKLDLRRENGSRHRLEQYGALHMGFGIGDAHGRDGRSISEDEGFLVGVAVAAAFNERLAGLGRQPGIDEIMG